MLHSTIAKIERRTSSIQRESKKIYSSALQNVPELKRGVERMITLYFTPPRFKCASTVVKTLFKIYVPV